MIATHRREFVQRLIRSHHTTARIAEHFLAHGHTVAQFGFRLAPEGADWRQYIDPFDVCLYPPGTDPRGGAALSYAIEVKGFTDVAFTTVDDCPVAEFIVDRANKADRERDRVDAYLVVSKDFRAFALLDAKATRKHWVRRRTWNRPQQRHTEDYYCAREFWDFSKFYTFALLEFDLLLGPT